MVIENITVIDPNAMTSQIKNLYISDGVFTDTAEGQVIDGTGLYAAPGFKDIHVHCFAGEGGTVNGLSPDIIGASQGVVTVVDAGSVGIENFDRFKKDIIDKSATRTLFFLNIARKGLSGPKPSAELADMAGLMTYEELSNFQKENSENLVGIKVRMSRSVVKDNGVKPLVYAKEVAVKAGLPLMVHIGNAPPDLSDVLNVLDKGDIVTHCFHGKQGGLKDYAGEFLKAAERGVQFDVGHGSESFSYNTVEKVMAVKSIDFSISTDIYDKNYDWPVVSLMETMSKFFPLGYTLPDLVRKVTLLPSGFINRGYDEIKIGSSANLSIFKIEDNAREMNDSEGVLINTGKHLVPAMTIINGKCVWSINA